MPPVRARRISTHAWIATAALLVAATPAIAQTCPAVPPPVRDLDVPRFYSDAAGSKIDPRLKAANEAAVAPLIAFVRHVANEADTSLKSASTDKRQAAARCALTWLDTWARAGAWLGRLTQQGEYQRKWDLAGVSLAYIKVKPHATSEQRRAIENWLDQVAVKARAFFDNPERKRNNHWYWLGLALGGVAIATDNPRHWAEATRIFEDAAADIDARGMLPMELARGQRALHYHAFAAMPLVLLAELMAIRGQDAYRANDGALHKLVAQTVHGLVDPTVFDTLSGVPQILTATSVGAGWLSLYERRFPGRVSTASLGLRTSDRRIGGDVILLMSHLQRATPGN